jgi:hypothetical protein
MLLRLLRHELLRLRWSAGSGARPTEPAAGGGPTRPAQSGGCPGRCMLPCGVGAGLDDSSRAVVRSSRAPRSCRRARRGRVSGAPGRASSQPHCLRRWSGSIHELDTQHTQIDRTPAAPAVCSSPYVETASCTDSACPESQGIARAALRTPLAAHAARCARRAAAGASRARPASGSIRQAEDAVGEGAPTACCAAAAACCMFAASGRQCW